jgi:hypothetical protein
MRTGLLYGISSVVVAGAALAQPVVVATSRDGVPVNAIVATYGFFGVGAMSSTGRIAFLSPTTNAALGGWYSDRAGIVTVAALYSGGPFQTTPWYMRYGMSSAGDIFSTALSLATPSTPRSGLWRFGADGTERAIIEDGMAIPGLPGRTVDGLWGIPGDGPGYPNGYINDAGPILSVVSVTPIFLDGVTISSALVAVARDGSSMQLVATSGNGAGAFSGTILPPRDVNASGRAVFVLTGPAPLTSGVWYWDGAVLSRMFSVGDTPAGSPFPIRTIRSVRINDAGVFLANVTYGAMPQSSTSGFVMGVPGDFEMVIKDGDVLSSPRETVRLIVTTPISSTLPFLLGDSAGVAFMQHVDVNNPTGPRQSVLVEFGRNRPARVIRNEREPVRDAQGNFYFPQSTSYEFGLATNLVSLRMTAQQGTGAPSRAIRATVNSEGDAVAMLVGDTSFTRENGEVITLSRFLNEANAQFGQQLVMMTNELAGFRIAGQVNGQSAELMLRTAIPTISCSDIDFNNDGIFPEDQDIIDFFDVLAGAACPTLRCDTVDFNRDGVFPEDADVIAFLSVLAGGGCE